MIEGHGRFAAQLEQQIALAQGAAEKYLNGVDAAGVGFRHTDQFFIGRDRAAAVFMKGDFKPECRACGQRHAISDGQARTGMTVKADGILPGG